MFTPAHTRFFNQAGHHQMAAVGPHGAPVAIGAPVAPFGQAAVGAAGGAPMGHVVIHKVAPHTHVQMVAMQAMPPGPPVYAVPHPPPGSVIVVSHPPEMGPAYYDPTHQVMYGATPYGAGMPMPPQFCAAAPAVVHPSVYSKFPPQAAAPMGPCPPYPYHPSHTVAQVTAMKKAASMASRPPLMYPCSPHPRGVASMGSMPSSTAERSSAPSVAHSLTSGSTLRSSVPSPQSQLVHPSMQSPFIQETMQWLHKHIFNFSTPRYEVLAKLNIIQTDQGAEASTLRFFYQIRMGLFSLSQKLSAKHDLLEIRRMLNKHVGDVKAQLHPYIEHNQEASALWHILTNLNDLFVDLCGKNKAIDRGHITRAELKRLGWEVQKLITCYYNQPNTFPLILQCGYVHRAREVYAHVNRVLEARAIAARAAETEEAAATDAAASDADAAEDDTAEVDATARRSGPATAVGRRGGAHFSGASSCP